MFVEKLRSSSITACFHADVLYSMYQQAEFLYDPAHWRRYSNWGTFENSGFALFAIMFPEFDRSETWLKEVFFRMRFQLENSFHDDGMHIEVSPSYHTHEMEVWFRFLRIAELNGISNPWHPQIPLPSLKEAIVRNAEAAMYCYKPTGSFTQVGDTDDMDERRKLYEIGKAWDRPDLLYVATDGEVGEKPCKTSVSFPDGGYQIMRSGWGSSPADYDQELYLLFDSGTNQPWHAHYDMLNIVASAYGHDILKDSGRFTYNESAERDYFKSTAAHNTIVVDGANQQQYCKAQLHRWSSFAAFDYVSASHNGYPGLTHARSVFFCKPDYWIIIDRIQGADSHYLEQAWHLSPEALGKVDFNSETNTAVAPHLLMSFCGNDLNTEIETGRLSYAYRKKVKAPVIVNHMQTKLPAVFVTLLYPFPTAPPKVSVRMLEDGAGPEAAVAVEVTTTQHIDLFFERKADQKNYRLQDFETDAGAGFVRRDKVNNILSWLMIQGTWLT